MSRIRTIKPEFWVSEQCISCSPLARLLFIGLWTFADDNGIHPASYVKLKAEIFPLDNISVEEMKTLAQQLIVNELLREYTVEEKAYWIVTSWKKHQRIDKPTYRHPLPEQSDNIDELSAIIPRGLDEGSMTDWNGMERNGEEDNICEVETSPVSSSDHTTAIKEIFLHWQKMMGHQKANLDRKRKAKIRAALKQGYTVEQLKRAIDGCAKTPYNMGDNPQKQRYDSIGLIFRDADHIERFMANAINPPVSNKPNTSAINTDVMKGVI